MNTRAKAWVDCGSRAGIGTISAVVALCLLLVLPAETRGQDPALLARVGQAQLEYQAAQRRYENFLDQHRAVEGRFLAVLDSLEVARGSGDSEAEDRALGRVVAQNVELQRSEGIVEAAAAELDQARRAFLDVLDERLEEVERQLSEDPPPAERLRLDAVFRGLQQQFFDLDDARPTPIPAGTFLLPNLRADPRDTPQEIRFKIQLFERRVGRAEETLADVRRRIERAERLQNTQRLSGDFAGGIERFGDTQVPTGATGQGRERSESMVGDTTNLTLAQYPLDAQLQLLRVLEGQLETQVGLLRDGIEDLRATLIRNEPEAASPEL